VSLDVTAIREAIQSRLPRHARWRLRDAPLDFHFFAILRAFGQIAAEELHGDIETEWLEHLVIGDYDYDEGGGARPWITVCKTDASICGLDVERNHAVFLFNSSIEPFIQTFEVLDQYLGSSQELPSDIEPRVRDIDPRAYADSEWRALVRHLTAA
jgi:hypothetical protein